MIVSEMNRKSKHMMRTDGWYCLTNGTGMNMNRKIYAMKKNGKTNMIPKIWMGMMIRLIVMLPKNGTGMTVMTNAKKMKNHRCACSEHLRQQGLLS